MKRKDIAATAPRDDRFSRGYKPGLMNRHSSQVTYGKATINPMTNDETMCIENCPVMKRLCTLKGISFTQSASPDPKKWPRLQSQTKVGKSTRAGAKMMF